ncbi:MAG TPA: VWA domain-containing protein, partial [Pyrinomonadaceae bacterium]|nr:VWA domain-containing protein [Pyrinomonadaceae bacterium]
MALVFFHLLANAQSQDKQQPQKTLDEDEVIRVRANLVNVDVMVKDRKGKYVSDLKPEDFTVFENGVTQKVEFFDPPALKLTEASGTQVQRSGYPKNVISLVLDNQTTDVTNLKRVREAAIKYVRQISDTDAVALFSVTSGLQLLQPFTQDKTQIIAALQNAGAAPNSSKTFEQRDISGNIASLREQARDPGSPPSASIGTPAAGSNAARAMIAARVLQQFIRLRTTLSLQQSRPILAALAAICEGLRTVPGTKTLVLFSQGFVSPAVLDWQVQSTIDIANRANVALYIIDAAGLRANAPRSGSLVPSSPLAGVSAITDQEQRIKAVGGETIFDNVRQEGESREFDILYRLSGDTGGKFIKGNNDIVQSLERIDEEIRARYTLAYRSTDQNFDGAFRKLKIEVKRPDAKVISREGYYAIPQHEIVPLSPEEKKLLATFDTAEAVLGFPLFVELNPFRAEEGLYTVPVSIEVPPSAIKFELKDNKQMMQLDILGVIRDAPDRILFRLGGYFNASLTPEQYQAILSNNVFYRQDLQLGPGEYSLDLIVRDRRSGKTAARKEKLVLAEANTEFAASPAVLSRHVEPAGAQSGNSAAGDIFIRRNARIRPSPARRFNVTDNLIIFLAVYNAADNPETGKPMVRVTVQLMKDGKAATKPLDFVLTETEKEPVPHLTFAEYIRLTGLAAGNYTARIEIKDMVTRKQVKQDASFVIA